MRTVLPSAWVMALIAACASPPPHTNDPAIVLEPLPARPLPSAEPVTAPAPTVVMVEPSPEPARLQMEDFVVGRGTEAIRGRRLSVHYVCTLTDGTMVDNSRRNGRPFEFTLGSGMVIRGWEQGLEGMRVGGRRRLTIPPELAYGERGRPPVIPERATLLFDIELVGVR